MHTCPGMHKSGQNESSLDAAACVADIDEVLRHHVQLLQGVWVLRVLDVPDVLRTTQGRQTHGCKGGFGVQYMQCQVCQHSREASLLCHPDAQHTLDESILEQFEHQRKGSRWVSHMSANADAEFEKAKCECGTSTHPDRHASSISRAAEQCQLFYSLKCSTTTNCLASPSATLVVAADRWHVVLYNETCSWCLEPRKPPAHRWVPCPPHCRWHPAPATWFKGHLSQQTWYMHA